MIRETIQSKLEEINSQETNIIEFGKIIADDIVVENTTYFGYELSKNYIGTDFDKHYTYKQNITGYVVRLLDTTENTQEIVDTAVEDILDKLKELNFKCNSRDIDFANNLVKVQITGYVDYNEINNKFIV